MDKDARRLAFESIVVQGIWLCIRLLWRIRLNQASPHRAITGSEADKGEGLFRANALHYFDEHGNQSAEAPAFRRERTFPELPR